MRYSIILSGDGVSEGVRDFHSCIFLRKGLLLIVIHSGRGVLGVPAKQPGNHRSH